MGVSVELSMVVLKSHSVQYWQNQAFQTPVVMTELAVWCPDA